MIKIFLIVVVVDDAVDDREDILEGELGIECPDIMAIFDIGNNDPGVAVLCQRAFRICGDDCDLAFFCQEEFQDPGVNVAMAGVGDEQGDIILGHVVAHGDFLIIVGCGNRVVVYFYKPVDETGRCDTRNSGREDEHPFFRCEIAGNRLQVPGVKGGIYQVKTVFV